MPGTVQTTDGSVATQLRTSGWETTVDVAYDLTRLWIGSETDIVAVEYELEKKFHALAEEWRKDTQLESSVSRIAMHHSYQQIIAMGQGAIPFILRDLQRRPGHWFWALRAIAGESPVPPEAQGNIRLMARAWLDWGRKKGYLSEIFMEPRSMSDTASVS